MDIVKDALWLASQTPNTLCYLPPSKSVCNFDKWRTHPNINFCGVHFILSYKENTKVHTVTWHTVIVIKKLVSEWQKIKVQGRMFNACDWSNTISTQIILSVSIQSKCLQLGRKKGLSMPRLSKQVTLYKFAELVCWVKEGKGSAMSMYMYLKSPLTSSTMCFSL